MKTFREYTNETEIITEGFFGAAMDIFTLKGKMEKLAKGAKKELEASGIKRLSKIDNEEDQLKALRKVLNRYEQLVHDSASVIDSMRIGNELKDNFKDNFKDGLIKGCRENLLGIGLKTSLEAEIKDFTDNLEDERI